MTLGFGDPRATAGISEETAGRDQPVTNSTAGEGGLSALSLELLRAVDEGRPARSIARELAVEALRSSTPDSAPWLRAVAVLEAGALRVRAAVDLAGLVLDAAEEHRQRTAG